MNILRYSFCLLCAAALPAIAESPADLNGHDAPLFSGHDQDGNVWRLSDHIGKQMVFLYFYPKDDSSGCTAEACGLRDNMAELKQTGVEVVGVSFDDIDSHKNFAFKYNLDFSLLADPSGAIADAYGARLGERRKAGYATFSAEEIKDIPALIDRWEKKSDPASALLWRSLTSSEQSALRSFAPSGPGAAHVREIIVHSLNKAVDGPGFYKEKRFKGISLRPGTVELAKQNPSDHNLALLNRLLLEDVFPMELSRNQNADRRVSFLIGLDGKIIHVTDSPDPAAHVKELTLAVAKLKGR